MRDGDVWTLWCFILPPPTPPNKQRKHAGRTSKKPLKFYRFYLDCLGWIFIPWVNLHPLLLEVGRSPKAASFRWVTGPKQCNSKNPGNWSNQWKCSFCKIFWVVASNIVYFSPRPMEMIQFEWVFVSNGLVQPPTSFFVEIICLHGEFQVWFHIFIAIRWGCCTLDNQTNTSLPQSPRLFWLALFWRQWDWLRFWWWQCHGKYLNFKWIWSNYSNLTRPGPPKGSKSVPGNPRLFQGYLAWWNIMNHLARWMVANGPTQVKGEIFDELFLLKGDTIWFVVYKYVLKNIWNPSFWVCVSLALVVKCCKLKTIYCKDLKLWVEWLVFFAIPDFASSLILAKSQRSLVNRQI